MTTAKKRISLLLIAVFLCTCFSFALAPREAKAATFAEINQSSMFLKQGYGDGCVLTSTAMMVRRRAYIDGNSWWSGATEKEIEKACGEVNRDMKANSWYGDINIQRISISGKRNIINLLNEHPEGIKRRWTTIK